MYHLRNRWRERPRRAASVSIVVMTISVLTMWGVVGAAPATAGQLAATYTELPLGTSIALTSEGTVDWVKWGITGGGPSWVSVGKAGVPQLISRGLTPLGTPPPGTNVVMIGIPALPPGDIMNFNWTDGTGPVSGVSNTIVTETILPAQFDYPLGLGSAMSVPASAQTRVLDVYVQGFNANMVITATLSGGGSVSTQVTPTKIPPSDPNNYSSGRFRVTFAGAGETLTVTIRTVGPVRPGSVRFPNAGFFAASLRDIDVPAPTSFAAAVNGLNVTFSWGAAAGATSYLLEVGSGTGLSNLLVTEIGGGTSFSASGPAGVYFIRLRARVGATFSAPSNEVTVTLGAVPTLPPPTSFAAQVNGLNVVFSWGGSPGANSYQLEVGTGPGQSNLLVADIGGGTSFAATGPAGTYFVRLRARAGTILSPPSNEISFTLACVVPGAPSGLAFTKTGPLLFLTWSGGTGASVYRLLAGTGPGQSNAFNGIIGSATGVQINLTGVPPGVYFVRVRSENSCGGSGSSNEVAIPVP